MWFWVPATNRKKITNFNFLAKKGGLGLKIISSTVMWMVDSSVGGKTWVNVVRTSDKYLQKNAIGNFYAPSLVLMNLSLLDTLPQVEAINGFWEAIKMGLIWDRILFNFMSEPEIAA